MSKKEMQLENKTMLKNLEQDYVDNLLDELPNYLEEEKNRITSEILEYANAHKKELLNKYGDVVGEIPIISPIIINNYFFKPITKLGCIEPTYSPEKLSLVYDYYCFIIAEINDKIGYFPSSLTTFSRLAGISLTSLRQYKNSSDIHMRNIVEKIWEQIGDDNLTMSQLGQVKEKSTIFKLEAQHEVVKKNQPNINISYKEVVNLEKINSNLEKYKALINKKGDIK